MGSEKIYLSKEGYEKLRSELEYLKTVKSRELTKEVGEARAHGDISENAELDAAKEAQGLCMKRMAELEEKMYRVSIIDDMDIPKDKAYVGATVKIKDMDTDEELERTLVSGEEADPASGKISIASPVGKGLLGHKEGDVLEIKVPAGVLNYKIIKISR